MMIVDAMHCLDSEQDVLFLLTAYVESLQCRHTEKRLPPRVDALPLTDATDVEARFTALLSAQLCGLARPQAAAHDTIAREATDVFDAACARLQVLRSSAKAPSARGIERRGLMSEFV